MQETSYIKDNQNLLEVLKQIEKLRMFSDQDLRSFLALGKLRKYEAGEDIIKEGEYDCWIYFLISGLVEIIKQDKIVYTLRRGGDLFGEMGIVNGSPRSATIRAAKDTLVLGVDGSLLDRKANDSHATFCYTIYRFFSEVLADRLRITTEENIQLKHQLQQQRNT